MRHGDLVLGGAAVAFGAAIFLISLSFPKMAGGAPGPALFPQILGVLLVLFGAMVVSDYRRKRPGEDVQYETAALVKGALVLVFIGIYVAVVTRLGFVLTSIALLLSLMLMLGVRARMAALSSIGIVLFCVVLFQKLLRVPLPPGILGF